MSKRLKNGLIIIVGIILLPVLIVASEIVYNINNSSPALSKYLVKWAQYEAGKGKIQCALDILSFDAKVKTMYQHNKFNRSIPLSYNPRVLLPSNQLLLDELRNYIASINLSYGYNDLDSGIGKVFYNMGLVTYRYNYPYIAEMFLKTALYTYPQLSSYHIEIVNFYFTTENIEQANEAISFCLQYETPKNHYQEYKHMYLSINKLPEIGFLQEEIQKHYLK